MQTAFQFGQASAEEALDQAGGREYPTLAEALEAYWENCGDTFSERPDFDRSEVADGFRSVLVSRGIEYRPHGLN